MPTITEEKEQPMNAAPVPAAAPPTSERGKRAKQRKVRQVQGELIGSKRNNIKVASKKTTTTIN